MPSTVLIRICVVHCSCRHHKQVLGPTLLLQELLQRKFFGDKYWAKIRPLWAKKQVKVLSILLLHLIVEQLELAFTCAHVLTMHLLQAPNCSYVQVTSCWGSVQLIECLSTGRVVCPSRSAEWRGHVSRGEAWGDNRCVR